MQVEAYTGAVMLLRKILMNISVNNGAEKRETFEYYINFLYNENLIHKKQKSLMIRFVLLEIEPIIK